MSSQQPQIQPYPGLRPFSDEEDFLFFGREQQVTELLKRLRSERLLAVVGSSGSGKSSLVLAILNFLIDTIKNDFCYNTWQFRK